MSKKKKLVVYVASAYTRGDPAINVHFQCRMFNDLMNDGQVLPYVPLWCHFQHTIFPRKYEDWLEYDNGMIERCCDVCLRLTVEHDGTGYSEEVSSGADREVELFRKLGRPVFFSKADLYAWIKENSDE